MTRSRRTAHESGFRALVPLSRIIEGVSAVINHAPAAPA